jgi:hypothetical protein
MRAFSAPWASSEISLPSGLPASTLSQIRGLIEITFFDLCEPCPDWETIALSKAATLPEEPVHSVQREVYK